jgi:putative ABC transport system permease protein
MNAARIKAVLGVNIRLCINEILSNRLRTVITSLGIFLGVASLLVNLAFVRAMDNDVKRNMEQIGGLKLVTIKRVEPVTPQEKLKFRRSPGLTMQQAEILAAEIPHVQAVIHQKNLRFAMCKAGGKQTGSRLTAADLIYREAFDIQIGSGRWFSREEIERGSQVCVIGTRIVSRLFGPSANPVGKTINVRDMPVTIVGIIDSKGAYARQAMDCIIPYSVYEKKFRMAGATEEEITMRIDSSVYARQIQRDMTAALFAMHRGINDFEVTINLDRIKEMQAASVGMKAVLWSIAVISLLVGGISIMNIMFATIGDRIREIGIRKAIGARNYDIFAQFLIEAMLVCLAGGIPGMLLGASVTMAPQGMFPFEPALGRMDYIMAVAFMLLAGFLSGLFPALRAAKLLPVEALRF